MKDHQLQIVARFVYKHRKNVLYWTSPILLEHPEVSSLKLTVVEAGDLFRALYEKDFLRIDGLGNASIEDREHQIYQVDRANLSTFREFASFPCYYRFLPDSFIYLLDRLRNTTFVCVLLIVTSFFQGFTKDISGRFSDWVWSPKVITEETEKEEQDSTHQFSEQIKLDVLVEEEVKPKIEVRQPSQGE